MLSDSDQSEWLITTDYKCTRTVFQFFPWTKLTFHKDPLYYKVVMFFPILAPNYMLPSSSTRVHLVRTWRQMMKTPCNYSFSVQVSKSAKLLNTNWPTLGWSGLWSNCFSKELHNIEEVGSFDEIKIKGNWNKYLRDVKRKYFLLKIFF